jgi:hypothetical protein
MNKYYRTKQIVAQVESIYDEDDGEGYMVFIDGEWGYFNKEDFNVLFEKVE